ncbi:hypothetical protein DAPPUDRAFT_246430 [Daphnia pulex]|uniref:Uncharacterized protein n=1 Tax=Daphnia pulex TaxID=6669 RepID=E9GQH2_DAPPU|nr:hypothetical protein DAPPUDRAFT_246430 [Daphnia pulex]|eukprot:EFX78337.1 hypothetical protein DAPPUDRAFT_246430 [Daphnia pulex]
MKTIPIQTLTESAAKAANRWSDSRVPIVDPGAGDVGSSSNTPSSQQPGAPDSGGSLSSLAPDRCGKCHQFLFSRTELILLIGSIYYATTTNNISSQQ